MTRLLWSCAAVVTLFITVESLTCYTCDLEVVHSCLKRTEVNCSAAENRCYKAVAKFSGELFSIYDQGCIQESDCTNVTSTILNVNYTVTMHCCNSSLCNGAATTQLPLATALWPGLGAAVLLWSQSGL